ncbi:peptidylprolyl isomerase [Ignatzschineria cameli]|uniref:PpiC domain-containing protein n=1 Tax=Ignatzschineria cameli TaxID=2182793 RepID=A0A2U2AKQ4_9GAMM|nr:peptidylprolyl isomerase [Ignatzschineria cameli]PWD83682.1 hypothetical protein DC077_09240 [Ignatzschineria cameli]PWD88721.1 hypothetical protein DC079_08460 [Ignatzschineria cameli]PWD89675.1 hypothetical protein DC081_08520 [Ignatzschineria cameli]PWD90565.1 hypothetical protein DC078_08460 [Ignatzschineria cameli]
MMQFIRDRANSVWAKVLLGGVAISLAGIGGTQIFSGPSADTVATVDGEKISLQEVEAQYQQLLNANAQNVDLSEELQRQYRLIARQDLLQRRAMDAQIKKWGIRASDKSVAEEIISIPAFQKDGVFDQETYKTALFYAGYNIESFEEAVRRDVQEKVVREALVNSVFIPEKSLIEQIEFAGQTRDIEVASYNYLQDLDSVAVSDEAIAQHYDVNHEKYVTPNRIKLQYIELLPQSSANSSSDLDAEAVAAEVERLQKASEQRLSEQFTIEYTSEAEKEDAIALLSELKAKIDLGELTFDQAKERITALDNAYYNKNGNFKYGVAGIPIFDDALFSLTIEEPISVPIITDGEVHMIHLLNISSPYSSHEALVEAAEISLKEKVQVDRYLEQEMRLQELAETYTESLSEIAQDLGVELKESDWLNVDNQEGLLANPTVWNAVNSYDVMENGRNSLPFAYNDQPNHAMIVRIAEQESSRPKSLEESFDEIKAELAQEKAKEGIQKQVTAMLEAGDQQSFRNDIEQLGFAYNQYNDLSISSIGRLSKPVEQHAVSNGFQKVPALEEGKPSYLVEDIDGHIVVIAINNIAKGSLDDFSDDEQMQIREYLQGIEASYEYRAFQQYLLNNSNIKIYNNSFFE